MGNHSINSLQNKRVASAKDKSINAKSRGFTLVEVLIVILIIGLLFIFLVPKISSSTTKAKEAGVKNDFHSFQTAMETITKERGGLGGSASIGAGSAVDIINEYLDPALKIEYGNADSAGTLLSTKKDPWNNKYHFAYVGSSTGNDGVMLLISSGKDGVYQYGSNAISSLDGITGADGDTMAAKVQTKLNECLQGTDDYIIGCAYISGTQYTASAGFGANIDAAGGSNGSSSVASAPSVGSETPEDCFDWNGTTITGFSSTCGHTAEEHANIVIPGKCTAIGYRAFYNCTKLTSITIPNSVTSIGTSALEKCTSLTDVTIHNGVTSLSGRLFDGCSSLESITIPNSVTSIGNGTFSNCTKLTSIIIPDSVTSIGSSVFYRCIKLTSITIPNSITHITTGAFSNCSRLTSVTIPNSVTSIDDDAFNSCGKLASITIPDSVTSIGAYAFQYSGLTSITIPNSVTSIGLGAFASCSRLTSLTVPDSVTSIGYYAFSQVPHIEYHGTATGAPWGARRMN